MRIVVADKENSLVVNGTMLGYVGILGYTWFSSPEECMGWFEVYVPNLLEQVKAFIEEDFIPSVSGKISKK